MSHTVGLVRVVRSGCLAVLEPSGRFDEAGIHSQSQIIVVAGYVANAKDWDWLEEKWQKILDHENVAFYHTTDIEADPPRGIYKGWTRAQADHLTDLIAPIAVRFKGTAFGVHIKADSWYAAVPFVKNILPERPHDAPYQLLAKDVIEKVIESRVKHSKERVSFLFAENDFTGTLVAEYEILRTINPRPDLLGPLAVDRTQDQPSLQAADLLAWHYRNANEVRLRHQSRQLPVKIHRWTLTLIKGGRFFEVPKDKFAEQVANLFRQHGTEWSNQVFAKLAAHESDRQKRKERGKEWRGKGAGTK